MTAQAGKDSTTAYDAPDKAAFDPTYTSSVHEARRATRDGSVTVSETGVKSSGERRLAGTKFAGQFVDASAAVTETAVDGRDEFQLEVANATRSQLKAGIVEGAVTAGGRGRYKVALPQNDTTDPRDVSPLDPTTIPRGGSVILDGQQFTGTQMEARFRNMAVESQMTEAQGASYRVDRLSDGRVRVSTGPNEAVEAFNGVGFSAGKFSAVAGRQDGLGHSSVRSATFDLEQADGRAAYAQFVETGRMQAGTPGLQDLATIERIGMNSQSRLKLDYNDKLGVDVAGQRNAGDIVRVRREDGSYTERMNLEYSGNLPMSRISAYGADGKEDLAQRRYEFTFDLKNNPNAEQIASLANSALAGRAGNDVRGPLEAGKVNTLVLDEGQMRGLMQRTQAMVKDNPMMGPAWHLLAEDGQGRPQQDVDAFAVALARNQGHSAHGMAERLFHVAAAGGQDLQKIDATVRGDHLQGLPPPSPLLPQQDPRHASSPDHAMWCQSQGAVGSLDQAMGRTPDEMSERLSMALLVAARLKGMERIDEAVLSDDGRFAFAVQGEAHAADRQIARADTAQAVATPVSEQVRELPAPAERSTEQAQAAQQERQVQEQANRAMAR
ncbi:XVIPCD domain-containing protein [Stenotrophomonas sp.]|uniref:XVIPCD domain-containing protein n=1 Tax=Stenotrophomonas sp. TaxID=69392 RepID=UPI0028B0BA23|nr:XVIPCD domain-containing protein [Stenotrophomonas sp.]